MISSQLENIPIRVRWHGWESDTYTLKRSGWKIFASESLHEAFDGVRAQIAIRDPEAKFMISGSINLPMRILMSQSSALADILYHKGMDLNLFQGGDRVMINQLSSTDWGRMDSMQEIDGFASMNFEERRYEDLKLFKVIENPKEIIVASADVDFYLNKILEIQFPEQEILKQKEKGIIQKPVFQAKIYSLAA